MKYDDPSSGLPSLLKVKNTRDETPLYVAVELRHLDIVQILISAGSNPAEPCIRGWTAIHEAAVQESGHYVLVGPCKLSGHVRVPWALDNH